MDEPGLQRAIETAAIAATAWEATPAHERAATLERAADLLEANLDPLLVLCIRKPAKPLRMPSPKCAKRWTTAATTPAGAPRIRRSGASTGADGRTQRALVARPWRVRLHQPLELPACDLPGQVSAALAAGNAVIAKQPNKHH